MSPAPSILITECLQGDFVKPIGRHDPLPNVLHVGHEESHRLMGENPSEGPVARLMLWTRSRSPEELLCIHIRDWHDENDAAQETHFRQFGAHCVRGTAGAEFVFPLPEDGAARVVDSPSLNDFQGTDLAAILEPWADQPVRVGITGVWTEAKVFFLAYELVTRYPAFHIAVCSALTASASRAGHFIALEQMRRLLGVTVHDSLAAFVEFLGGEREELPLPGRGADAALKLSFDGALELGETDERLLRHLFRDCRSARFRVLDGGFSGNVVLGSESTDLLGHAQVPHVVKIGRHDLVGRERSSFERIESVLGNTAPRVADFADLGDRGAIKYRYASMGEGSSTTFQRLYMKGLGSEETNRILRTVFVEQLGRLYGAATRERCDLLEYYCFSPNWAPRVRRKVEDLLGGPAAGDSILLPGGLAAPNPCRFYECDLASFPRLDDTAFFSYVHGDLNGANIIVDAAGNVWLIDFFHTHRGHVLKDLAKLENDLLYIFTPVDGEESLAEAARLTDALVRVEDLARPLPPASDAGVESPSFARAWETLSYLRSFHAGLIQTDRDPLQLFIALLRYAVHTLSFDEPNRWQRLWALYAASRFSAEVTARIRSRGPLRVDWLDGPLTTPGRVGLTILPGRRDLGRDLAADVAALKEQKATHVVTLVTSPELAHYGVPGLLEAYRGAGLEALHESIMDQSVPSREQMARIAAWLSERVERGGSVVVHCVGGLGRSGTVAAAWLRARGLSTEAALAAVRTARSPRAVETRLQETFVERAGSNRA